MIPLGGNTVFMRRSLIERVGGWDQHCLTEDADIGLRLSTLGEPIRVVYDAEHVTREETPESIGSFIRQRTRWQQGFLQVLRKGNWLALPQPGQRLLALYTLSYPFFQAFLMLLWPLAILDVLWVKVPDLVAMISFLPLYALLFQLVATITGAFIFTKEYGLKFPLFKPIGMALSFLPFQWLLGISAVRSVYRELRKQHNWEKTAHWGAHRQPEISSSSRVEHVPLILPKRAVAKLVPASIVKQVSVARLREYAAAWSTVFQQVIAKHGVRLAPRQAHSLASKHIALVSIMLTLSVGASVGISLWSSLFFPTFHTATGVSSQLSKTSPSLYARAVKRINSTPSATSSVKLVGTYSGTIYNIPLDLTTNMSLTGLQQSQRAIAGYFIGSQVNGLPVDEPFRGTIDAHGHIQFIVAEYGGQVMLSFDGTAQPNGTLAGTYCSRDQQRQCAGEYGLWSVVLTSEGGSR